jgi:hypothetical protein
MSKIYTTIIAYHWLDGRAVGNEGEVRPGGVATTRGNFQRLQGR